MMNNRISSPRTMNNTGWLPSMIGSGSGLSRTALMIYAGAMLTLGGFFLINYPLETTIVALFVGSVFSMGRK